MNDTPRATTAIIHDNDYRELNEQAHPKVPPRLSAPALNWHVAIWNPSDEGAGSEEAGRAFGHWTFMVAELLTSILLNDQNAIVSINDKSVDASNRRQILGGTEVLGYKLKLGEGVATLEHHNAGKNLNPFKLETFGCSFFWNDQLVKLVAEVHREYLTLTVWLPAYHMGDGTAPAACEGDLGTKLRIYQAQLLAFVVPNLDQAEIAHHLLLSSSVSPPDNFEEISSYLYEQIWTRFSDDQLEPFFRRRPDIAHKMQSFADFRSIILPAAFPHNIRDAPDKTVAIDMSTKFSNVEARAVMGRLGRFFERDSGARAELSGTLFLNKRVVYASSYGSAAERPAHFGRGRSTRYIMVAKPGTRWQLGRLVERLNIIGTYRLAAIRNLSGLNEASEEIRAVGRELDLFQRTGPRTPNAERRAFEKLNISFAAISSNHIVGGLNYRVERSRYYVESFKRTLPDLRIARIEGYQPYDEFVRRRYEATWDRISRLGYRHGRLQDRMDFLSNRVATSQQLLQSKEQNSQTKEQVKQTREQVKQSAELIKLTQGQALQTSALERQSEAQVELLRTAEWVGVFPVTYYASSVLGGLIEILHGPHMGEHGGAIAPLIAAAYLFWLSERTKRAIGEAERAPQPESRVRARRQEDLPSLRHERAVLTVLITFFIVIGAITASAAVLEWVSHEGPAQEARLPAGPPSHVAQPTTAVVSPPAQHASEAPAANRH